MRIAAPVCAPVRNDMQKRTPTVRGTIVLDTEFRAAGGGGPYGEEADMHTADG